MRSFSIKLDEWPYGWRWEVKANAPDDSGHSGTESTLDEALSAATSDIIDRTEEAPTP